MQHLDIYPTNILFDQSESAVGIVKISGLCCSKNDYKEGNLDKLSQPGGYVAPELFHSEIYKKILDKKEKLLDAQQIKGDIFS